MDRSSGGEPGLHFEVPSVPETADSKEGRALERGQPAHNETAPSKATPSPSQAAPQLTPLIPAVPATTPTDQTSSQQSTMPIMPLITSGLSAADGNLIEKEWVEAAKNIIAKTRSDPYQQKQEVSRIKADYQMKRFNKQTSADDAVAA